MSKRLSPTEKARRQILQNLWGELYSFKPYPFDTPKEREACLKARRLIRIAMAAVKGARHV